MWINIHRCTDFVIYMGRKKFVVVMSTFQVTAVFLIKSGINFSAHLLSKKVCVFWDAAVIPNSLLQYKKWVIYISCATLFFVCFFDYFGHWRFRSSIKRSTLYIWVATFTPYTKNIIKKMGNLYFSSYGFFKCTISI